MSYSINEAQVERDHEVMEALNTRDTEALYKLAALYSEEGDDEEAEKLLKEAKRIDGEDWAYDEAIGN